MLKYKAIIGDNNDFNDKIIQPMKDNIKGSDNISWLKDADKFYSIDMLSYILKNAYNERYIRYDTADEFIGYFSNIFMTVTPMFFSKISNIIEDKLKDLQTNENVGKKTNVTSKSNRGTSGRAFDNTVGDGKQTATEESDYTMDSRSDNILDNAKKLAQSKISGEVTLYVASFAELFSTLDFEGQAEKQFTPALIAILSDIAVAVATLGKIVVHDGAKETQLIDFTGKLMSYEDVAGEIKTVIDKLSSDVDDKINKLSQDVATDIKTANDKLMTDEITPLTNRVKAIGLNQIEDETGNTTGFDDDKAQTVLSKEASNKVTDKLEVEINVIKSAGVHIPHYATDADRDSSIPNPFEGDVCYVGANGSWILNTFENNIWVKGIVSQHSTSTSDPTKADKTYVDANDSKTLTNANTYTDGKVSDLIKKVTIAPRAYDVAAGNILISKFRTGSILNCVILPEGDSTIHIVNTINSNGDMNGSWGHGTNSTIIYTYV